MTETKILPGMNSLIDKTIRGKWKETVAMHIAITL